ncbi:uncharacterized protein LOC110861833 [Folsomia candida]|uniref:uncharacterized protein LOC110861833 n=1 Tax=Folsomia candida TaxID=158441 RepID=UPI000B9025C7|nr:uncharacterized protein LOC110861833 [Folsomia candida]
MANTCGHSGVIGVKVACLGNLDAGRFIQAKVNHNLLKFGDICPIPEKFGLSLLAIQDQSTFGTNQISTRMMISVANGFAPFPKWQNDVGDVVFVRQDRKPLTAFQMEALHGFNHRMLQMFDKHEGNYGEVQEMMTKNEWSRYWEVYKHVQICKLEKSGEPNSQFVVAEWKNAVNVLDV